MRNTSLLTKVDTKLTDVTQFHHRKCLFVISR